MSRLNIKSKYLIPQQASQVLLDMIEEQPLQLYSLQAQRNEMAEQISQIYGQDFYFLQRFFYSSLLTIFLCVAHSSLCLYYFTNITAPKNFFIHTGFYALTYGAKQTTEFLVLSFGCFLLTLSLASPFIISFVYYKLPRRPPPHILLSSGPINDTYICDKDHHLVQVSQVIGYSYLQALRTLQNIYFNAQGNQPKQKSIVAVIDELENQLLKTYTQMQKPPFLFVYQFYNPSDVQVLRNAHAMGQSLQQAERGLFFFNQNDTLFDSVPHPEQILFQRLEIRSSVWFWYTVLLFSGLVVCHTAIALAMLSAVPNTLLSCSSSQATLCDCLINGVIAALTSDKCVKSLHQIGLTQFLGMIAGFANAMLSVLGISLLTYLYSKGGDWRLVELYSEVNTLNCVYLFICNIFIPAILNTPVEGFSLSQFFFQTSAMKGFPSLKIQRLELNYLFTQAQFGMGAQIGVFAASILLLFNQAVSKSVRAPPFTTQIALSTLALMLAMLYSFQMPIGTIFSFFAIAVLLAVTRIKIYYYPSIISVPDNLHSLNFIFAAVSLLLGCPVIIMILSAYYRSTFVSPWKINFTYSLAQMPLLYLVGLGGLLLVFLNIFYLRVQAGLANVQQVDLVNKLTAKDYLPAKFFIYKGYFKLLQQAEAQAKLARVGGEDQPNVFQRPPGASQGQFSMRRLISQGLANSRITRSKFNASISDAHQRNGQQQRPSQLPPQAKALFRRFNNTNGKSDRTYRLQVKSRDSRGQSRQN